MRMTWRRAPAARRPAGLLSGLLVALALACSGAAQAARTPFQVRCEDTISKTVSVLSARQNGYSINQQLSYHALTRMKGGGAPGEQVLGLTRTESRIGVELAGPILQDAESGYECVAPRISVKLDYVPAVIYVGLEFASGTCAHAEILKHELRHLNAYMEHLPKVEKVVREALARRFEARPLYAPSGTAMSALEHEINSGWLPYIKAELGKVEAQQALIDSPEEYARLGKACGGAIQTILQRGLRPH